MNRNMTNTTDNSVNKQTQTTTVNTPDVTTYDVNKSLYDTKLSNVFAEYQRNTQKLEQSKQQSLEDAYMIRELSRKYLGEYASNAGIGDVSGNLVDIYSNYNRSVQDINKTYNEQQLGLDTTYQEYAQNYQNETALANVQFNLQTGNIGDMTPLQYIRSQSGVIGQANAQKLYSEIYQKNISNVMSTLESGLSTNNFGLGSDGEIITNAEDYLKKVEVEYDLSTSDMKSLREALDLYNKTVEANKPGELVSYRSFASGDLFQPKYDPSYYSNASGIGLGSEVFLDKETGTEYIQVLENVDNDTDAGVKVSSDELFTEYQTQFGTTNARAGDIIAYKGNQYLFKQGSWHRLVTQQSISSIVDDEMQKSWVLSTGSKIGAKNKGETAGAGGSVFTSNGDEADTLFVNGVTYVEDYKASDAFNPNKKANKLNDEQKRLIDYFNKIHGEVIKKQSNGKYKVITNNVAVFFEGRFWEINVHGKIVPMKKKES